MLDSTGQKKYNKLKVLIWINNFEFTLKNVAVRFVFCLHLPLKSQFFILHEEPISNVRATLYRNFSNMTYVFKTHNNFLLYMFSLNYKTEGSLERINPKTMNTVKSVNMLMMFL